MIRKQAGFTLLEMLFVLAVFLIISIMAVFTVKNQYTKLERDIFFSQFQADVYYAQQYAISHQHQIYLNLTESQHYYVRNRFDQFIVDRHYPKEIEVWRGTIGLYIMFLPNGNINSFGSFGMKIHNEMYKVTFLIGRGRFYIEKTQ